MGAMSPISPMIGPRGAPSAWSMCYSLQPGEPACGAVGCQIPCEVFLASLVLQLSGQEQLCELASVGSSPPTTSFASTTSVSKQVDTLD